MLLWAGMCLGVMGCREAPAPALPWTPPEAHNRLGPDDVFEVTVYGEPELSGSYRIASDGSIDFPLVGRVQVGGLNTSQLSERLTEALARYVRNPSVSVFVKEFNSQRVYVFGQVQKPGTFKYEQGMNIIQAITLAGGFARFADKNATSLTRMIDGREHRVEVSVESIGQGEVPNLLLQPGDIVYVPESVF